MCMVHGTRHVLRAILACGFCTPMKPRFLYADIKQPAKTYEYTEYTHKLMLVTAPHERDEN